MIFNSQDRDRNFYSFGRAPNLLGALLFGGDELGELAGCLSIPIFWGWDSCLVPSHGRYFVFHSNDEFIDILQNRTIQLAPLKGFFGSESRIPSSSYAVSLERKKLAQTLECKVRKWNGLYIQVNF